MNVSRVFANLGVALVMATGCGDVFDLEPVELSYPNHYPCDCNCSPNVNASGLTVYTSPDGLVIAIAPPNATGTVIDGPESTTDGTVKRTWLKVDLGGGLIGWVDQAGLALSGASPIFAKHAQVCLPERFNGYLGGTDTPTIGEVQALCEADVASEASVRIGARFSFASYCDCEAQAVNAEATDASCSVPCPDGADVCLVAGSDPPDPIPELISATMFTPMSTCDVTGDATLVVDGHTPKAQPTLHGTMHIFGRPCTPGSTCRLGLSYSLLGTDIEFESDTIFADDPKFVELGFSGATEPASIEPGLILGFYLGEIEPETAYSTLHGRRSGQSDGFTVEGRNTEGLALAVNWPSKVCRVAGQMVGQAEGTGDEGTFDGSVDIAVEGTLMNQPPHPSAGADQTVECTSATATPVTLDASGSTDVDGNIELYEWTRGAVGGVPVALPSTSPVVATTQALGSASYSVLVVDRLTSALDDAVSVNVVDTTAPTIQCASPAMITPSDVSIPRGLSFTATATDGCSGVSNLSIRSVTCKACKVSTTGATLTITNSGGIGDVISWVVATSDAQSNTTTRTCSVRVVGKK